MDYVAIGYDRSGKIRAFTTGKLSCCRAAAKAYRLRKNYGSRLYPIVKIITWKEWEKENANFNQN